MTGVELGTDSTITHHWGAEGLPPTPVGVNTKRPYSVWVGHGLLENLGEMAAVVQKPGPAVLVSDKTVAGYYGEKVKASLTQAGFQVLRYTFPPGEKSKNLKRLSHLLERLGNEGFNKGDLIVALGGGVVGDLAGLAAAIYSRGTSYIQLPTTLLAAVDSSVGGKTAVNLNAGKNLVGAVWQPKLVVCDCNTFLTLPRKELASGVAECLKYGVLGDEALFDRLATGFSGPWEDIVIPCLKQKANIVGQDETDDGGRRLLNLGHTAGHAIERLSGYTVGHGEGVGLGMLIMARAAERMGICIPGVANRIEAALKALALPSRCPYTPLQLARLAKQDKKRRGDEITLVLPEKIGHCVLRTVKLAELRSIFALGMEGWSCV